MSIIYTVDPAEVASETNFHTIQEAIDAAAGVAGAGNPVEIRIAAGIYKEALTFPAGKGNITLSGARAGVDASSPERGTGETVLVGYILGADGGGALTNVTIDGMTIEAASQAQIDAGEIRNSGNVPYHGVIWSQYQSDGFTLKNNIITNAGNPAKGTIWLGAQENATITGNRVTTVLPDGEVKKAATLEIGGTSGTTTITGNVFDSAHNAVNLSGNNGGDITISGNRILNAAKCGIQVTSAPAGGSISITGNVIDNYGSAVSGKAEDEAAIAFQKRGGAGNEAVVTVTGNSVKGDYDVPLLFFSNNPADVAGSVIRDNVFQGGSSTGVYIKTSQGVLTADLAVADNFYLNAAGAQLTEVPAVQVESDSTVNTTPDPEAAVISPAVVVETGASVVIVDAAWAACEAGTLVMAGGKCYTIGVNAFGTVQAAADGVETGGTVRIQAGVYDENLMLTRSMTLLGAAENGTVLNGGIGAAADHVVIDGLFIRPGSVNTVDANGDAAAGVSVEKHGITGLTVRNCRIDCSAAIGGNVKVYGITAGLGSRSYYSSAVTLENNRITGYTTGNAVSATAQNGIYLRFVSGATVSGNTVEGFSHHLMQFQAGSDATVTNNVVRDTDRNGIQFGATASGSNLVKGNAVSDCRGASSDDAAIVLRNDGTGSMTVTGNEVTGNKTGVYISEVTDVTQLEITGNIIDGNTIDIAGNSTSDITLSGNNYGADGEAVVSQQGAGKLDPGASASAETATTSIFINPAWAGQTTVIGPDGKFYTVGVNAFASADEAAAKAAAGDSVHIFSAVPLTLGTELTAGKVYLGDWDAVSGDPDAGNVGSLTLGAGSRLVANHVYVGTADEVLGVRSSQLIVESGAQLSIGNETLNIRYDGYVKFDGWDGKTVSNVTIFNVGGFADINAAHLTGHSLQVAADTTNSLYATAGAAKLTMTHGAELVLSNGIQLGRKENRHGILELDNAVVTSLSDTVYVGRDDSTPGKFGTGELYLKNGAALTAVNVAVNDGSTIVLSSGSTLKTDSMSGSGTITVSYDSSLVVAGGDSSSLTIKADLSGYTGGRYRLVSWTEFNNWVEVVAEPEVEYNQLVTVNGFYIYDNASSVLHVNSVFADENVAFEAGYIPEVEAFADVDGAFGSIGDTTTAIRFGSDSGTAGKKYYAKGYAIRLELEVGVSDITLAGNYFGGVTGMSTPPASNLTVAGGNYSGRIYGGSYNCDSKGVILNVEGNTSAERIYGGGLYDDATNQYTEGDIVVNIGSDVNAGFRYASGQIDGGRVTAGDVTVNFHGKAVELYAGAQVWDPGQEVTYNSITLNFDGNANIVRVAGLVAEGAGMTVANGIVATFNGGTVTPLSDGSAGIVAGGGIAQGNNAGSRIEISNGVKDYAVELRIANGTVIKTEVAGGIQAWSNGGKYKNIGSITGGTYVSVSGGATILNNLYGGNYNAWGGGTTLDKATVVIGDATVDYVFGGSKNVGGGADAADSTLATVETTDVTIGDGAHILSDVAGGGFTNWVTGTGTSQVTGKTVVRVTGGTIDGNVVGGGYAMASSKDNESSILIATAGSTEVTLSGGVVKGDVYGGGYALDRYGKATVSADVAGDAVTTISGTADITGSVFGGGFNGDVDGNVTLDLNGASLNSTKNAVYGGGYNGNVGNVLIDVDENSAIAWRLFGGGLAKDGGTASAGDITINLAGTVGTSGSTGSVFGGAWVNNPTTEPETDGLTAMANASSATINILSGASADWIYGGSMTYHYSAGGKHKWADARLGETNINMTGGEVGAIVGGGKGGHGGAADTDTEKAYLQHVNTVDVSNISISGGTAQEVYGGAASAGLYNAVHVGTTNIEISGTADVKLVYGGGQNYWAEQSELSNTVDMTNVTISGGTVGTVYGGAYCSADPSPASTSGVMTVGTAKVTITGGSVGTVYGGGNNDGTGDIKVSKITGDAIVELTGGSVGTVYGGGNNSDVGGDVRLTLSGVEVNNVYGAGCNCVVGGNLQVDVTGDVTVKYDLQGETVDSTVAGVAALNVASGASLSFGGSVSGFDAVINNGTIHMDYNSTLAFGSFENAGTISISLDGYCGGEKKLLLDYTGSETLTGEYYSKLLGSSWSDACFTVENNDLYLNYDSAVVVYVNSTYSEENCGGHTWGVDAFADHESAMAKNPVRVVSCGGEFSSTVALNSKEGQIDGGTYKPLLAGHLVNTDVKNWDDHEGNLTVRINDGTFTSNVIGADGVAGGSSERTGNVSMTIDGGTFSKQVAGGMYLAHTDSRGSVILTGDIDLTISGGTFDGRIYGGNFGINDTVSGRMSMKGNINLTIDAGKALTVNEHISAGSRGRGTVDGNVTVTVTGNGDNLTFDGLLFGGCSGDLYRTNNGVRTADTSVTGDRKLVFDGFSNGFDGTVSMFESVRFAGGSSVAFTNAALNLSDISNWDFEFGSSLSGVNRNNFAGDTLNFDLTGWAGDQWEVMSGSASAFSGWNDASRVTLGGESAAWDSDISGWCSSNYQLTLEEDGDGRKLIIAGKLA